MSTHDPNALPERRSFLRKCTTGVACLAASQLEPAYSFANDRGNERLTPSGMLRLEPDIEPLVRLIEQTPRDQCLAKIADELRKGLTHRNLTAALFLAGVRNIEPFPGNSAHAVYAIHSAHQMSLDSPPGERMLPLFWALDRFKGAQKATKDWEKLKALKKKPPSPENALREFHEAMEALDGERADAAVVGLLQSHPPARVLEELWWYGAKDNRPLGHKAIYVANGCRTLDTIGWHHAEPVLRHIVHSLAYYKRTNRIFGFTMDNQCHTENSVRVKERLQALPSDWTNHKDQPEVVRDLVATIRTDDHSVACGAVLDALRSGRASAGAVWDAVHLIAGEIVMRTPEVRPVHAVTSANALHYAFIRSTVDQTRLYVTLQAVGWMCHFIRSFSEDMGPLSENHIDQIATVETPGSNDETIALIFDKLATDPTGAARLTFSLAQSGSLDAFQQAARSLIFTKGHEFHRYKIPAAAFEDVERISPRWRPHFMAANTYYLCNRQMPDSKVIQRAREVLA